MFVYVGGGGAYRNSILSTQFGCEPETSLKSKAFFFFLKLLSIYFILTILKLYTHQRMTGQ